MIGMGLQKLILLQVKTMHNEETEKLWEAKENLEAAQVTAQKKLDNKLNSMHM